MHAFISFSCWWVSVVSGGREDTRNYARQSKIKLLPSLMGGGTLLSFLREGRRETSAMSVATWSHLYL